MVEGLQTLKNLEGLNLANNQIEFFKGSEFPDKLQLVSMKNNPVALVKWVQTQASDYKVKLVKYIPELEMLDGEEMTMEEKFKLQGMY